jgi:hypothetical protein
MISRLFVKIEQNVFKEDLVLRVTDEECKLLHPTFESLNQAFLLEVFTF